MSATNRGSRRNSNDRYITPGWLVDAFYSKIAEDLPKFRPGSILEPGCGDGAFLAGARRAWPGGKLVAHGIDLVRPSDMAPFGSPCLFRAGDFLKMSADSQYELIVTNPPYSMGQQFIEKALALSDDVGGCIVAMLLRLNFLGSKRRAPWWRMQGNLPEALWITPFRPSFAADGATDATEYAFYLWNYPGKKGLRMLETDLLKLPRRRRAK